MKKTIFIGTLTAIILSGCAGTAKNALTVDNSFMHKTNLSKDFYSGNDSIPVPNKSFAYCFKDHCAKDGLWINKDSQYTRYSGSNSRPLYTKEVKTDIRMNGNTESLFIQKAKIALRKAKEKIKAEGIGFKGIGKEIKLTTNGDRGHGFGGFCIQPIEEGSEFVDFDANSNKSYFWNLKHCYDPYFKKGKLAGWTEYDQSVCSLYKKKDDNQISKERAKANLHELVSGERDTHIYKWKWLAGASCWNLGEYTPDKVSTTGYTTPAEFVHLITEFNKEFEKSLGGK